MAFVVLLVLYAMLLVFHAASYREPEIAGWKTIAVTLPLSSSSDEHPDCQSDSDCLPTLPHHVCFQGKCLPKFLHDENCDDETGRWVMFQHAGASFVGCECLDPLTVGQKVFGGNCNVQVACRPHGILKDGKCVCPPGYEPVGLTCRRVVVADPPCTADETDAITAADGFADKYIALHANRKCHRRPCTFDAFTGQSLPPEAARYLNGVGCVCDPTFGLFGVRLETPAYVRGAGFNACVGIFAEGPKRTQVSVYAYFYLMDRSPVVFLQYSGLDPDTLIDPFRDVMSRSGHLQIGQEYPYDFVQQVVLPEKDFMPRHRQLTQDTATFEKLVRAARVPFRPVVEWCRYLTRHVKPADPGYYLAPWGLRPDLMDAEVWKWQLLYRFPACYVGKNDTDAPKRFRGHFVSNPLHLTMASPKDDRSNGIMAKGYTDGSWAVDFAPPKDVDTYAQAADARWVPVVGNKVLDATKRLGVNEKMLKEHEEEYRRVTAGDRVF